jgi:tRNA (mo5U34)-methyltransferase
MIRHTDAVTLRQRAQPLDGDGRQRLAEEVACYRWYHTLELGDGVVTAGMFDHRPAIDRYLLPRDLTGMRCLDVGTMDGFWAFEMERRGAAEVIAADVGSADDLDWPPLWREMVTPTLDDTKAARFGIAHSALGSSVTRIERSVYELDSDLGAFDLVFCGDLLVHLKDPITAVQRMRLVCRSAVIVCNPVTRPRIWRQRPLAEFDGIDDFRWWLLSEPALERMVRAAGFARVERGRPFKLPARAGGKWKGRRAIVRGFVD